MYFCVPVIMKSSNNQTESKKDSKKKIGSHVTNFQLYNYRYIYISSWKRMKQLIIEMVNIIQNVLLHCFYFCRKSTENEEFYSRKKSSTDDDQGGVNAGLESKCSVSAIA